MARLLEESNGGEVLVVVLNTEEVVAALAGPSGYDVERSSTALDVVAPERVMDCTVVVAGCDHLTAYGTTQTVWMSCTVL